MQRRPTRTNFIEVTADDRPDPAEGPAGTWSEWVDAKFRPPTGRPGIVARTELVDRLRASPSVISVVAPPGYGKTTLLSQWASAHGRRDVAWVSVDRSDNDTSVLLTNAALALDKVEPIDGGVFRTLASPGAATAANAIARIASTLASRSEPVRLVFDHAEMLDNPECRDAIAELAMRIPEGSQLAIATRDTPPLQTALLRSRREMVEIGIADLAMNEQEAAALLEGAGVTLDGAELAELVRRTEGWPVGLYLAALAISAGGKGTEAVAFTGDHRLMASYLQSEFLSRLSSDMVSFLTRTALLDRMSGPLCDAVLGATKSAQVLEALESSNLLLVPLDPRRQWYRYHHLFRELLSAELKRAEPALVPELHDRAAEWFENNGMPETAIDHAQAADDADRVARLVAGVAQAAYGDGRVDTARRWFGWFGSAGCSCGTHRSPSSVRRWRRCWDTRLRPSTGPTPPSVDTSRGRSRTAARWMAGWRISAPFSVETVWPRCGPMPRPPWLSWLRGASCAARC